MFHISSVNNKIIQRQVYEGYSYRHVSLTLCQGVCKLWDKSRGWPIFNNSSTPTVFYGVVVLFPLYLRCNVGLKRPHCTFDNFFTNFQGSHCYDFFLTYYALRTDLKKTLFCKLIIKAGCKIVLPLTCQNRTPKIKASLASNLLIYTTAVIP